MHLVHFAQNSKSAQALQCTLSIDFKSNLQGFWWCQNTKGALIDNWAYQQHPGLDPDLKTQVPCFIYAIQKEQFWRCTLFKHTDLL